MVDQPDRLPADLSSQVSSEDFFETRLHHLSSLAVAVGEDRDDRVQDVGGEVEVGVSREERAHAGEEELGLRLLRAGQHLPALDLVHQLLQLEQIVLITLQQCRFILLQLQCVLLQLFIWSRLLMSDFEPGSHIFKDFENAGSSEPVHGHLDHHRLVAVHQLDQLLQVDHPLLRSLQEIGGEAAYVNFSLGQKLLSPRI